MQAGSSTADDEEDEDEDDEAENDKDQQEEQPPSKKAKVHCCCLLCSIVSLRLLSVTNSQHSLLEDTSQLPVCVSFICCDIRSQVTLLQVCCTDLHLTVIRRCLVALYQDSKRPYVCQSRSPKPPLLWSWLRQLGGVSLSMLAGLQHKVSMMLCRWTALLQRPVALQKQVQVPPPSRPRRGRRVGMMKMR